MLKQGQGVVLEAGDSVECLFLALGVDPPRRNYASASRRQRRSRDVRRGLERFQTPTRLAGGRRRQLGLLGLIVGALELASGKLRPARPGEGLVEDDRGRLSTGRTGRRGLPFSAENLAAPAPVQPGRPAATLRPQSPSCMKSLANPAEADPSVQARRLFTETERPAASLFP